MDGTLISTVVSSVTTGLLAVLAYKQKLKREKRSTKVAMAAVYTGLQNDLQAHIRFIEERFQVERKWYKDELERERLDCDERISGLAGKLAYATKHGGLRGDEDDGLGDSEVEGDHS